MRTGVKLSSLAMVGSSLWHARVFGEATECQIPSRGVFCPGILLYCIHGPWMQALRFRESYQFESVRRTAIESCKSLHSRHLSIPETPP